MSLTLPFSDAFGALTGFPPFPWQERLYEECFRRGSLPSAVDIPTGLGKTAVMVIWMLARAAGADLPRRLVYVVDRRAVVDQATEFAERLRAALHGEDRLKPVRLGLGLEDRKLPISTLRGRHVDNREWMADPTSPAIIVGTVDMVGSRLLFEGYGLSRRMRPFAAGLLGCDSLVLLDEAHLARPFGRLLRAIEIGTTPPSSPDSDGPAGTLAGSASATGLPPRFRVLPLSATLDRTSTTEAFGLDETDEGNPIVRQRLHAPKRIAVEALEEFRKLDEQLADRAWALAADHEKGTFSRVAIFCNFRKDAEKVADALEKRSRKENSDAYVIRFVGGRRVHERQQAADELVKHGFIGDSVTAAERPTFLVATSAGEVGVDLDAEHMVCDLVAWERMVQRLGRVNRRGSGAARVVVIDQGPPAKPAPGPHVVARHLAVAALLDELPRDDAGEKQAGPAALAGFASHNGRSERTSEATTPMPLYPALTRPLVDAWAMTSIEENAGRPAIAPWLRGWVEDDRPQTAVLWRRFLPICSRVGSDEPAAVRKSDAREFFAAAAPQAAELLETESARVVDWLRKRGSAVRKKLVGAKDEKGGEPGSVGLSVRCPVVVVLDRANGFVRTMSLDEIEESTSDKRRRDRLAEEFAARRVVVDVRIGGLTDGLLDEAASDPPTTIEDNWVEAGGDSAGGAWTLRVDRCEQRDGVVDGWFVVSSIPLVESEEGEPRAWLVVRKRRTAGESEHARSVAGKLQRLEDHHDWTGEEAARIAARLGLAPDESAMLVAAARFHDHGKAAARWQRAFDAPREGGPFAKTKRGPNQHLLNGFRHELKSAFDAERMGLDGVERGSAYFDLALHLIAAHHGNARPGIKVGGYDDLPPSAAEAAALAIGIRFARQQRQWGPWGLAWWEALLRSADQAASRKLDEEGS